MSGLRYDAGKNRLDLLSIPALWEIGRVYTEGAKKYEDRNWEKGLKYSSTLGCLMRHLFKWIAGHKMDEELPVHHMALVAWNAITLLHMELLPDQYAEFNDLPDYQGGVPNESVPEDGEPTETDQLRQDIENLNSMISKLVYGAPEVREGFRQMLADMDPAMKAGRMTESAPKLMGLVQQLTTNQPAAVMAKEGRVLRGEDPTPKPDTPMEVEDHTPFVRAAVVENPREEGLKEQIKLLKEQNTSLVEQVETLKNEIWDLHLNDDWEEDAE